MGRPKGFEAVAPFVKDTNPKVRLAAIRSLGQMGKFDAIPLVEPFLQSSDLEERKQAIIAMGKFAKPDKIPAINSAAAGNPEFERLAREAAARIAATVKGISTSHYDDLVDAVILTDEFEDLTSVIFVTKFRLLEILSDKKSDSTARERALRILALAKVRRAGSPMRRSLPTWTTPFPLGFAPPTDWD